MENITMIGVKSTQNLWVYPLIGFDTYLMYERDKNIVSAWRSFKADRIKLMPIKRGKNNVN